MAFPTPADHQGVEIRLEIGVSVRESRPFLCAKPLVTGTERTMIEKGDFRIEQEKVFKEEGFEIGGHRARRDVGRAI